MLQVLRNVSTICTGMAGRDYRGVADILVVPDSATAISITDSKHYLKATLWADGQWHEWNTRAEPQPSFERYNKTVADPIGRRMILTGSPSYSNIGTVSKIIPATGNLPSSLEVEVHGRAQWCEWGDGIIIEDGQEL